ncbi:CheR family methyltransferase [Phenylobacterium sp.]|uniref:CheR family methyltransferase n=1 Tax=Phenylobacterium sp. TaxID=1871053 RepID=UPI0025F31BF6|nr:CheR family methyltransferase [Phenylobacterium sp.]
MSAELAYVPDAHDSLSPANFRRLAEFIHGYSGIKMPPAKKTMLEGRLRRRLRALHMGSFDDYCDFLFKGDGIESEAIHLIDAVTTNKTDFFREPAHFDYLMNKALPGFVREGRKQIGVWSAACSIGAEPYTIAMLLDDFCADHRGLDYSILATDLCTQVLGEALLGIYPAPLIDPVPIPLRQRHVLVARDRASNLVRMAPHLRSKLSFARQNLMDAKYAAPKDLDMIFCRNLLIYFDKPTQAAVLQRLCAHLRPGGYLFLGHSETIVGVDLPVRTVSGTVFQKV